MTPAGAAYTADAAAPWEARGLPDRRGRPVLLAAYLAALVAAALLVVSPPHRPTAGAAVPTLAPLQPAAPPPAPAWLAERVVLPPPLPWLEASALAACGWYGRAAAVLAPG